MDLGRTAKFGSVGATGVILISLVTSGLIRMAWTDRITGSEGMAIGTMIIVGIAGIAITIMFLFLIIGAFLDRELEVRGLNNPNE